MKQLIVLRKKRHLVLQELKSYGLIVLGALILALAYALFIVPYNVVPGGIFGLSIVLHEFIEMSIGTIALLINIPLLIWGTRIFGLKIGLKTSFLMITVSIFLDTISQYSKAFIFVLDVLVSSIFGGALIGLAIAIVKSAGATTGGNDILVRIISIKVKLKFNELMLIINGVVILFGIITYGNYTIAAYSIIAIFAMSKTIGYFIVKDETNKTILVFSSNNALIQKAIENDSLVGKELVNYIHQDDANKMILITKNNRKLSKIVQLIYSIEPDAKVIVLDSTPNSAK